MPTKSLRRSTKCKTAHRRRKVHWKRRITGGGNGISQGNKPQENNTSVISQGDNTSVISQGDRTSVISQGNQSGQRAPEPTTKPDVPPTNAQAQTSNWFSNIFKSTTASPASPASPTASPTASNDKESSTTTGPWYKFWGGRSRRRRRKCKGGCNTRKTRRAKL